MYAVNIPIFINILAKKMPLVNRQRAYNIWISVINILHKKHKSEARSLQGKRRAKCPERIKVVRRRPTAAAQLKMSEGHPPGGGTCPVGIKSDLFSKTCRTGRQVPRPAVQLRRRQQPSDAPKAHLLRSHILKFSKQSCSTEKSYPLRSYIIQDTQCLP